MDDSFLIIVMDTDLNVLSEQGFANLDKAIDKLLYAHFSGGVVEVRWRRVDGAESLLALVERLEGISDPRSDRRRGWDEAFVVLDAENRKRARDARQKRERLERYQEGLRMAERSLRSRYLGREG